LLLLSVSAVVFTSWEEHVT